MTLACLLTIVGVALLVLAYSTVAAVPIALGAILTVVGLAIAVLAAVTKS